jgi:plastin-1
VDASGKVELEDWVEVRPTWHFSSPVSDFSFTTIHAIPIGQLNVKLRSQTSSLTTKAGKVTVQGSNANVSHTINEDERREFTNHINGVSMTCFRDRALPR